VLSGSLPVKGLCEPGREIEGVGAGVCAAKGAPAKKKTRVRLRILRAEKRGISD